MRLLFTKRKEHLDHQCEIKKSNPVEPFINDPSHLLVLPDRNVVWCPVFKAGSSTWLSIILDLSSGSKVCFLVPTHPYWAQYYFPMLDNVRRSGPFRKSNLVQFKINAA